jgi:hypothetical protein
MLLEILENMSRNSEITIFVIPSIIDIDWTSPSALLLSSIRCYFTSLLRRNYYVIGHTIARIDSPFLPQPVYAAMSGAAQSEKVDMVINKGLGFGAVGSTIHGHIEPEEKILRGLKLYASRKKVAFIKFRVNEDAVRRVIQYIDSFGKNTNKFFAPCEIYNGSLWPRYKNEGSGCSAFTMALLEVANLLPAESEWFDRIKIPMNLIGGEFNNNKKIKVTNIFRTKSWYEGDGEEDVDYITYKVFDPSLIFNWILRKRNENDAGFEAVEENGMLGLAADRHEMVYAANDPVFKQRTDYNLFVKHYYSKLQGMGL